MHPRPQSSTNRPRNLTKSPDADEYSPDWSPDSTMLVFARKAGIGHLDIFMMGVDGSGLFPLTDTNTVAVDRVAADGDSEPDRDAVASEVPKRPPSTVLLLARHAVTAEQLPHQRVNRQKKVFSVQYSVFSNVLCRACLQSRDRKGAVARRHVKLSPLPYGRGSALERRVAEYWI